MSLRIPIVEDQAEFDAQIVSLTKILVDSLNDKALVKAGIKPGPNDRSIKKLELFFQVRGKPGPQHIAFLHDLYALRSTGAAHRKGSSYETAAMAFGLPEKTFATAFEIALQKSVELLSFLRTEVMTS